MCKCLVPLDLPLYFPSLCCSLPDFLPSPWVLVGWMRKTGRFVIADQHGKWGGTGMGLSRFGCGVILYAVLLLYTPPPLNEDAHWSLHAAAENGAWIHFWKFDQDSRKMYVALSLAFASAGMGDFVQIRSFLCV